MELCRDAWFCNDHAFMVLRVWTIDIILVSFTMIHKVWIYFNYHCVNVLGSYALKCTCDSDQPYFCCNAISFCCSNWLVFHYCLLVMLQQYFTVLLNLCCFGLFTLHRIALHCIDMFSIALFRDHGLFSFEYIALIGYGFRWHWVANNNTYGNVLVSYESNAVEHHSSSHVSSCRNATITALDSMFLGTSLFAPVESILKQKWWCWWWWWWSWRWGWWWWWWRWWWWWCCWFVA